MTFSMIVILLVFVIVNYWARHAFEWKYVYISIYGSHMYVMLGFLVHEDMVY